MEFPCEPVARRQHDASLLKNTGAGARNDASSGNLGDNKVPRRETKQDERRKRNRDYMREYRKNEKVMENSSKESADEAEQKRRKKREYMRAYRDRVNNTKSNVQIESAVSVGGPVSPRVPIQSNNASTPAKSLSMTQEAIRQRRHRQKLSDEQKEQVRLKNRERQRRRRAKLEAEERTAERLRDAERMRLSRSLKTDEEKEKDRLKKRERQKERREKKDVEVELLESGGDSVDKTVDAGFVQQDEESLVLEVELGRKSSC